MPGPVALDDFCGRLQRDLAALDRNRLRAASRGEFISSDMLDAKPIDRPHHEITIAPRGIAVGLRFRRPVAVPPVGRAMEGLRGSHVQVQRTVGFSLGVVDNGFGRNIGAHESTDGCPVGVHRKPVHVVVRVHVVAEVLLLLIGDALDGLSLDFRAGQRRQKHPGQDGDDGDNDEQLDEREGEAGFAGHVAALCKRRSPVKR